MSVPDLLQFLAAGRKTGTLKIGRGSIIKQIYLEEGFIVGSNSNDPKELIGQALLHYGKIAEDQLQLAMQIHRQSGDRLGRVLSSHGFVSDEDIIEVLRTRTLEIIYDLFIWDEAEFEFIADDPFPDDLIFRIQVDATSVIMDGIYRIDEWGRYRKVISSDRTFFELNSGWTKFVSESKEVREVLYNVEKGMTAAEICYNLHTTPFHASAVLFDLVDKGAIKVGGEVAEAPADSAPSPSHTVSELLTLARAEMDDGNHEKALAIILSALDQEPQNSEAHDLREEAEKKFITQVFGNGLSPLSVPRLLVPLDELEHERLGPQEGFVLSRINGELNVDSILSVCPFREADTLRMIKKLLEAGVIGVV